MSNKCRQCGQEKEAHHGKKFLCNEGWSFMMPSYDPIYEQPNTPRPEAAVQPTKTLPAGRMQSEK